MNDFSDVAIARPVGHDACDANHCRFALPDWTCDEYVDALDSIDARFA